MKKVLSLVLGAFLLLSPIKASALNDNVVVDVKVSGEVKEGNEIQITVDVKDVERFYAASMIYRYNPTQLEILSMSPGAIVQSDNSARFEPNGDNGEIIKESGQAKYSFTFMGDYQGNKGSGNFMTIKAKVLTSDKLKISKDNMEIKLVERNMEDNMLPMKYTFNGYQTPSEETNGYPNGGGQGGNTSGNTSGNGEGSGSGEGGQTPAGGNNSTDGDANNNNDSNENDKDKDKDKVTSNESGEVNKDNNGTAANGDSKGEENKEDEGGSSTIFLVIGGVVILGAIGGFIYMKSKKKNNISSDDDNSIGM
ncbi:MAG: cohesin domain-containing protein [Clostridium sp.]